MRKKNTFWFSIIIAVALTFLLSFIGLFLLEYSIPFARNIKWVENASKSYFQAYAGIEESFYQFYTNEAGFERNKPLLSLLDYSYTIQGNGIRFPELWEWNSWVDINWNRISRDMPVQLFVGRGRLMTNPFLRFWVRIPNFDTNGIENLDTSIDDDIILWQLSSPNGWLFTRRWWLITESEINGSGVTRNIWTDNGAEQWDINSNTWISFSDFYATNCSRADDECILKISIIGDLLSSSWNNEYPYLEYFITSSSPLPVPIAQIQVEGKSFNYSRSFDIAVTQETTNAAFNFTIFQ